MEFHGVGRSIKESSKLRFLQGHLEKKKNNLYAAQNLT